MNTNKKLRIHFPPEQQQQVTKRIFFDFHEIRFFTKKYEKGQKDSTYEYKTGFDLQHL